MAKHGKKPNRTQRQVLIAAGYEPVDYEYVQMKGSTYVFRKKSDNTLIEVQAA